MGAKTGGSSQAAPGESLTRPVTVDVVNGYRLWAADYDETPNALLALEERILACRLGIAPGSRMLDAGSGTGRWMEWGQARGAHVFGIDMCREMVLRAERKPAIAGRSALADVRSIPLKDDAVDLAISSFTIGYLRPIAEVFRELARVSRELLVSDIHPAAIRSGWNRSFRIGGQMYELVHHSHSTGDLDQCARGAGLTRAWRIEASFGEPERPIFQRAGKERLFERARLIPGVLVTLWRK